MESEPASIDAFIKTEDIETIKDILKSIDDQYAWAWAENKYCDNKTQDLLHEMELLDNTYHQTAHLGVELSNIRRRRRDAKNLIELLGPIVSWKKKWPAAITELNGVIGKMREAEELQRTTRYTTKTDDSKKVIEHVER